MIRKPKFSIPNNGWQDRALNVPKLLARLYGNEYTNDLYHWCWKCEKCHPISPEVATALEGALSGIKDREQFVIRLRFSEPCVTQKAIGDMIDRGRERVRQIEANGLMRLRHPRLIKPVNDLFHPPSVDDDRDNT